jgi:hypothetical protein
LEEFDNGKSPLCLINHTPCHKDKWSSGSQARATAPLEKELMLPFEWDVGCLDGEGMRKPLPLPPILPS